MSNGNKPVHEVRLGASRPPFGPTRPKAASATTSPSSGFTAMASSGRPATASVAMTCRW